MAMNESSRLMCFPLAHISALGTPSSAAVALLRTRRLRKSRSHTHTFALRLTRCMPTITRACIFLIFLSMSILCLSFDSIRFVSREFACQIIKFTMTKCISECKMVFPAHNTSKVTMKKRKEKTFWWKSEENELHSHPIRASYTRQSQSNERQLVIFAFRSSLLLPSPHHWHRLN